MAGRYDAFLIRHWRRADGVERVEVTHVQSGTRALVPSLSAATDWISARSVILDDHEPPRESPLRRPPTPANDGKP